MLLKYIIFLSLIIKMLGQDIILSDSIFVEAENQLISNEKVNSIIISPVPGEKPEYSNLKNRFSNSSKILMQESSGNGAAPIYKGFRSNKLLYTINGIRFNNALFKSGNTPYLSLLNPIYFNNLNIAEGAVSLLYGSDAVGAALDFTNRSYDRNTFYSGYKTSQNLSYIGFNLENNLASLSSKFSVYYSKSGDLSYGENGNKILEYSNNEQKTGYEQFNIDYDGKYQIGKHHFYFGARIAKQYNADDFFRLEHKNNTKYKYDPLKWFMANIGGVIEVNNLLKLNIQSYFQTFEERKESQSVKDNTIKNEVFEDKISILGFSTLLYGSAVHFDFNTGINFNSEYSDTFGLINNQVFDGKYPDDSRQMQFGVFFNLSKDLSNDFKINGGLRYSYQKSKVQRPQYLASDIESKLTDFLNGNEFFTNEYNQLTYALSFNYKKDTYENKLIVNSSFRAPNFDDLGKLGDNTKIDGLFAVPNYNLKPETSFNITNQFTTHGDNYTLSIDAFYNIISNLIELKRTNIFVNVGSENFELAENQNIGESYLWGGTVSYKYFWKSFIYSVSVTHQIGQDKINNAPLSKIPPLRLVQSIRYKFSDPFSLKLISLYSKKQDRLSLEDKDDSRIVIGGTPEYHKLDLEFSYELERFDIYLSFENMTDQLYRNHSSALNASGRSLSIDFQFHF
jgi:hemoglobin/transferrin/lactoferrin receptor protein